MSAKESALLRAGALQKAIFNVGAEQMRGFTAAEVMNKITPAGISDTQGVYP